MSFQKIKKAVFPVAGFGTRFLPATKATPKEMLPIVDKPLVQYAVEEAISAGITQIIFVTSCNKYAIEDHFDSNLLLEYQLEKSNKIELLNSVRNILPKNISCLYVRQPQALGLGNAILCAKPAVDSEPFAILLADDLIQNQSTHKLKEMISLYENSGISSVLVEEVEKQNLNKYGIINIENKMFDIHCPLKGVIEKPDPSRAPSNFGIIGRYVFSSKIFHYLENMSPGSGGEIQLTDAIALFLKDEPVHAYKLRGKRYDCGSKLGFLEATIQYALAHPELSKDFRAMIQKILEEGIE